MVHRKQRPRRKVGHSLASGLETKKTMKMKESVIINESGSGEKRYKQAQRINEQRPEAYQQLDYIYDFKVIKTQI